MILSLVILSSVVTGVVCGFAIYNSEKGEFPESHSRRESSAFAVRIGLLCSLMPFIGIIVMGTATAWFRHGIFKFKP